MVHTYGIAPENDGSAAYIAGDGEDSALLSSDSTVVPLSKADGHATIISCVSNLSNTIIGSGMFVIQVLSGSKG